MMHHEAIMSLGLGHQLGESLVWSGASGSIDAPKAGDLTEVLSGSPAILTLISTLVYSWVSPAPPSTGFCS